MSKNNHLKNTGFIVGLTLVSVWLIPWLFFDVLAAKRNGLPLMVWVSLSIGLVALVLGLLSANLMNKREESE